MSSVPAGARSSARQVLIDRGMESLAEIAEVLVSELVTNAVKARGEMTRSCPVLLWVLPCCSGIVLVVWDASPLPPLPGDVGEEAESGRGLLIVQAVSARWVWDFPPGMGGKVVWAVADSE